MTGYHEKVKTPEFFFSNTPKKYQPSKKCALAKKTLPVSALLRLDVLLTR